VLQVGIGLYLLVCFGAFAVSSPLGANVSRLGQFTAGPILACLLWPHRRRILVVAAVPLLLWQWTPSYDGIVRGPRDPSVADAYYRPVIGYLDHHAPAFARVEVPPLRRHWESVHVAARYDLARGWERQLDRGYHALFYDGTLDASTYRAWLADNGVAYVALPDAELDARSVDEAALLRGGLPYLQSVLRTRHWQVWRVRGFGGLVDGPARLVRLGVDHLTVDVTHAGSAVIRVRWTPRWQTSCGVTLTATKDHWIHLHAARPGRYDLTQGLRSPRC